MGLDRRRLLLFTTDDEVDDAMEAGGGGLLAEPKSGDVGDGDVEGESGGVLGAE